MRYIVYGAGAVGGTVAARLFETDRKVIVIARGEHLAAIQRDGLRFSAFNGERTLPVAAVGHPSEIDFHDDDVVLLTTKTQSTEAALLALEAAAGDDIPVFCCQNGVESERLALRRFSRVYGVYVTIFATHLAPGVVAASAGPPVLGVLDPGVFPNGEDDLARRFAADMRAARLSSNPRADIRRWKYGKLLTSLGAPLLALCGLAADTTELRRLIRREGEAVLTAAGIDFVTESQQAARRVQASMIVKGASAGSTWQSLARGASSVESDYLNGEIVMLGRLFGIETPYNRAVRHLLADLAREHGTPGSVTPAQVMRCAAKTLRTTAARPTPRH